MESKSHFLAHFIPGILLGSVVGLAFGSLLVASQIPRVVNEVMDKPPVIQASEENIIPDSEIVAQSCDFPINDLSRECLFQKGDDYLPTGSGILTGRYLGIQTFADAWVAGKTVSCPVFEIDGGSDLIIDGLEKLAAAGSGVTPMKDGKFLWRLGTELPKNMIGTIEHAVKVYVYVPPQPEAGVSNCYSPFVPVAATEMI